MSQYDFGIIDPYVVDGVQLAAMLNNWRDAQYSAQRGAGRPGFAVPGQIWIDDSAGTLLWQVKLYVGPTIGDVVLYTINTETGTVQFNRAVIGDFLPLGGGTLTGSLGVQGNLNVNGPAVFNNALNAAYRIQVGSVGAAFVWYDPSRPANEKYWDAFASSSMWSLRAVNDAYSASVNPINISRSGYAITRIDHNSPLHYWFNTGGTLYGQWGSDGLRTTSDINSELWVGRFNATYGNAVINTNGICSLEIQAGNRAVMQFSAADGLATCASPPLNEGGTAHVPNTYWVLNRIGPVKSIAGGLFNADGSAYAHTGFSSYAKPPGQGRYGLTLANPPGGSGDYWVQVNAWGGNSAMLFGIENQQPGYFEVVVRNVTNGLYVDYPFSLTVNAVNF